jgi:hydroxymethylpyrimidine pyrophosphatase-like HAD family hydrolase
MRRYFAYSAEERKEFRARLDRIGEEILKAVPGAAIAADQPYREFDLAVDFAEDVRPLPRDAVQRIQQIFESHGARAKISSIHVNGWFGDFDKLTTTQRYLRAELGLEPAAAVSRALFIGDSPNDEPMFSFFPSAVGVAGLERFADLMTAWPAFLTEAAGGEGFAEAVDVILERRSP